MTLNEHAEADGFCIECGSEIDLGGDDEYLCPQKPRKSNADRTVIGESDD